MLLETEYNVRLAKDIEEISNLVHSKNLINIMNNYLSESSNKVNSYEIYLKNFEQYVNKSIKKEKLVLDLPISEKEFKIVDEYISKEIIKNYQQANTEFKMLILLNISDILNVIWKLRRIQKIQGKYVIMFNYTEIDRVLSNSIKRSCQNVIKNLENGISEIPKLSIKNLEVMYKNENIFYIFDDENVRMFYNMEKLLTESKYSYELSQSNSNRLLKHIKKLKNDGINLNINYMLENCFDSIFKNSNGTGKHFITDDEIETKIKTYLLNHSEAILYKNITENDLKILSESLGLNYEALITSITKDEIDSLLALKKEMKSDIGYFNHRDIHTLLNILQNYRLVSDDYLQGYSKLSIAKSKILENIQILGGYKLKMKSIPVSEMEKIINKYLISNKQEAVKDLVLGFQYSTLLSVSDNPNNSLEKFIKTLNKYQIKSKYPLYSKFLQEYCQRFLISELKGLKDLKIVEYLVLTNLDKEINIFNYEKLETIVNELVNQNYLILTRFKCRNYVEQVIKKRCPEIEIHSKMLIDILYLLDSKFPQIGAKEQLISIINLDYISFNLSSKGKKDVSLILEKYLKNFKRYSNKMENTNVFYNEISNLNTNKKAKERLIRLEKNLQKLNNLNSSKVSIKMSKNMSFKSITTKYLIVKLEKVMVYIHPNNHIVFENGLLIHHKIIKDDSEVLNEISNTFNLLKDFNILTAKEDTELVVKLFTILSKSFDRRFKII